jgi:hypothetical protein
MNEDYLHFAWKNRLYENKVMIADSGERIEIIHPGHYNRDAGPDFSQGRIRIDGQLWVGNIEIHVRQSDWNVHNHGTDPAYDSIILHVVYEIDTDQLHRKNPFPTIELKGILDETRFSWYQQMINSGLNFPCQNIVGGIRHGTINAWLERMLIERIERKTEELTLSQQPDDWEEIMYQQIARSLGLSVNGDPMKWLALSVPFRLATRYRDSQNQLEALLLGASGILLKEDIFEDQQWMDFRNEYQHLQRKHQIKALPYSVWKFFRLRPASFPTLRISQLAAIVAKHPLMFDQLKAANTPKAYFDFFKVEASEYWQTHYSPGKYSANVKYKLGKNMIHRILINGVFPVLFTYARWNKDEELQSRILNDIHQLESERNRITEHYKFAGFPMKTAGHSQGVLHLHHNYCRSKKCLNCAIGNTIISGYPAQTTDS